MISTGEEGQEDRDSLFRALNTVGLDPGTQQGYAVSDKRGALLYVDTRAVVNNGAAPGERTGDGAPISFPRNCLSEEAGLNPRLCGLKGTILCFDLGLRDLACG
jgi:hypothetical protein